MQASEAPFCTHDRRQSKREDPIEIENIRTCRVRIKILLPRRTKNVDILKIRLDGLHGISHVCANFVGSIKTDVCLNGTYISQPFLLDKSLATNLVERM